MYRMVVDALACIQASERLGYLSFTTVDDSTNDPHHVADIHLPERPVSPQESGLR